MTGHNVEIDTACSGTSAAGRVYFGFIHVDCEAGDCPYRYGSIEYLKRLILEKEYPAFDDAVVADTDFPDDFCPLVDDGGDVVDIVRVAHDGNQRSYVDGREVDYTKIDYEIAVAVPAHGDGLLPAVVEWANGDKTMGHVSVTEDGYYCPECGQELRREGNALHCASGHLGATYTVPDLEDVHLFVKVDDEKDGDD